MKPFERSDNAIKKFNRLAMKRLEIVKGRLLIKGFDELNVLKEVDALYLYWYETARKVLRDLWKAVYRDIRHTDAVEELIEMHMAGLLDEPNAVAHYIFALEVTRKRDRAKEAVESVSGKTPKQVQLDKALKEFARMFAWFSDFTEEDSEIQGYRDDDVDKVQRHERNDARTCAACKSADGEIYDIDKIPDAPHPNCRRWFTPV